MLPVRSECTLRVPSILTITIIDNRELPGITGGSLGSHEHSSGHFIFGGLKKEEGTLTFRSIVITPGKNP
jgi:hypothetical protein